VHVSSEICDVNVRCLNSWVLFPLVASAFLLFMLARALGISRPVSLATVALWLVSWPTVDALAWQATIHDRWALVFVLTALWMAVTYYPQPRSVQRTITLGIVGLMLVWLGCNSKEAAWFLAPTLALIAWSSTEGSWRVKFKGSLVAALPLAYTAWHALAFMNATQGSDGTWLRHVSSGDVPRNVKTFSAALLGLTPSMGAVSLLVVILIAVIFVDVYPRRARSQWASLMLWPVWLGFLMATATAIQAVAAAPYYMLVPHALLSVLMMATVQRAIAIRTSATGHNRLVNTVPIGLAVVLIVIFCVGKLGPYREFRTQSKNFQGVVRKLGELPSSALIEPPYLLHHPAAVRSSFLLFTLEWRSLWRFVPNASLAAPPAWLDQPVAWNYAWGPIKHPVDDKRTYIYLSPRLELSLVEPAPAR
jgi:hypothetical protein